MGQRGTKVKEAILLTSRLARSFVRVDLFFSITLLPGRAVLLPPPADGIFTVLDKLRGSPENTLGAI